MLNAAAGGERGGLLLSGFLFHDFLDGWKEKFSGRRSIIFFLPDVMMTLMSIHRSQKGVVGESRFKFPACARQGACLQTGTTTPAGADAKYLSCQLLLQARWLGLHCGGVRRSVYVRARGDIMSTEASSLSSPPGSREHLKTENRSKPWAGLR